MFPSGMDRVRLIPALFMSALFTAPFVVFVSLSGFLLPVFILFRFMPMLIQKLASVG